MRNRLSVDVSILRQQKVLQRGESKKREPKTPGALMTSLKRKALGKQQAWRSQVQLISIGSARAKEGDSAGREREREREEGGRERHKKSSVLCVIHGCVMKTPCCGVIFVQITPPARASDLIKGRAGGGGVIATIAVFSN